MTDNKQNPFPEDKPSFKMPEFDSPKNWTEDYKLDNGHYVCTCSVCKEQFYGHKRRVVCRVCDEIAPTEVETYAGTLHIGGDALGWQRQLDKWIDNEKRGIPPITGREKAWRLKRSMEP